MPGFAYGNFSTQLVAQSNNILVIFNKLSTIKKPDEEELLFEVTLNWTIANIGELFKSNDAPESIRGKVVPDLKTSGYTLMSHSSGGHIICMYLKKTCGQVSSLIMVFYCFIFI